MFTDVILRHISSFLGMDWMDVGHYLGFRTEELDRIQLDYPNNTKEQIFRMLKYWSYLHLHDDNCVQQMTSAFTEAGRKDIAERVDQIFQDGLERFKSSVKKIRTNDKRFTENF